MPSDGATEVKLARHDRKCVGRGACAVRGLKPILWRIPLLFFFVACDRQTAVVGRVRDLDTGKTFIGAKPFPSHF
jgi:hypothetical protein